jgi:hypothetical protein
MSIFLCILLDKVYKVCYDNNERRSKMNKTELAILLARERVKAQAELLASVQDSNPELASILKGANLYDHALQESLKQVESTKPAKKDGNHLCWYCGEDRLHPNTLGDSYHPYNLCLGCGATSTDNGFNKPRKALYLPYKKLANEVARLVGDARKAKLPLGYYQKALPERC